MQGQKIDADAAGDQFRRPSAGTSIKPDNTHDEVDFGAGPPGCRTKQAKGPLLFILLRTVQYPADA
ncbi:hypothetical protein JL111_17750 [Paracoccus sp. KCTC 42845]|jgi:hypothetical protein|uniref:Uncharacterized protein n=1 Tax=Paracoccus aerius TaxID=1915382 RepID=A0ABS1S9B4_9RHOB|nr:hypothetical protein [Paracoccus aerius]MBL3675321.1 hypothetical protein [Paracoccus aerius]